MMRLRRLRQNPSIRALFSETQVSLRQLVQPYFVVPGKGIKRETRPGYGLWQISPDLLREEILPLVRAGVGGVMLFGVPEHKRDDGHHDPDPVSAAGNDREDAKDQDGRGIGQFSFFHGNSLSQRFKKNGGQKTRSVFLKPKPGRK